MTADGRPQGYRGAAVVTGGGQGLGRAFALALAREGYPVAVVDLDGQNADRVADEVVAAGGQAVGYRADVSDEAQVQAVADAVAADFGRVEVLVNNAAVFSTLKMGPFTEIDRATWDQVIDVNVTGAFLCCRALVPLMAEHGYGKVINISSASVFIGRPGYLHYVTSKAALIGMTRALAAEAGAWGVRVNALAPGSTQTEIERETITSEARARMAEQTALGRVQTPEDLVGAVVFLASAGSDFITGQTLNVDGGFAFH